ncbi:MAG: PAS domain-containing protein [Pseudomonadota bacterium]
MVDTNGVIKFINCSATDLFQENIDIFREGFPGLNTDQMIGANADIFHESLRGAQSVLTEATRLPFHTMINIGSLRIDMNVSGVFDRDGAHVGCILEWKDMTQAIHNASALDALDRSQAVIEFETDGTIIHANQNFLAATGYALEEIVGKHHSMFMPTGETDGQAYKDFWRQLAAGQRTDGKFHRVKKSGDDLWINATYNPLLDKDGGAYGVLKIATDITASEREKQTFDKDRQNATRILISL